MCEMLPTKMNSSLLCMELKGEIMDEVNLSDASLFGLPFVNGFLRGTWKCHWAPWSQKTKPENSHVQICNPELNNWRISCRVFSIY